MTPEGGARPPARTGWMESRAHLLDVAYDARRAASRVAIDSEGQQELGVAVFAWPPAPQGTGTDRCTEGGSLSRDNHDSAAASAETVVSRHSERRVGSGSLQNTMRDLAVTEKPEELQNFVEKDGARTSARRCIVRQSRKPQPGINTDGPNQ
jgi:hypothetical protein